MPGGATNNQRPTSNYDISRSKLQKMFLNFFLHLFKTNPVFRNTSDFKFDDMLALKGLLQNCQKLQLNDDDVPQEMCSELGYYCFSETIEDEANVENVAKNLEILRRSLFDICHLIWRTFICSVNANPTYHRVIFDLFHIRNENETSFLNFFKDCPQLDLFYFERFTLTLHLDINCRVARKSHRFLFTCDAIKFDTSFYSQQVQSVPQPHEGCLDFLYFSILIISQKAHPRKRQTLVRDVKDGDLHLLLSSFFPLHWLTRKSINYLEKVAKRIGLQAIPKCLILTVSAAFIAPLPSPFDECDVSHLFGPFSSALESSSSALASSSAIESSSSALASSSAPPSSYAPPKMFVREAQSVQNPTIENIFAQVSLSFQDAQGQTLRGQNSFQIQTFLPLSTNTVLDAMKRIVSPNSLLLQENFGQLFHVIAEFYSKTSNEPPIVAVTTKGKKLDPSAAEITRYLCLFINYGAESGHFAAAYMKAQILPKKLALVRKRHGYGLKIVKSM